MPKQNTAPVDYPQAVIHQIEQLAHNIVTARKRRKETQAQWAQRLGVSQPTMARIERGDPAVAMASYVMCMWLVNQAHGLADLIAPQNDMASLEREVVRTRIRRPSMVRASAKKVELRATSGSTGSPASQSFTAAGAVAGLDQRSELEKIMRIAALGQTSELEKAQRSAGLDQKSEIEKVMRSAGLDQRSELEKTMRIAALGQTSALEHALRSAGLGLPGVSPNHTAASLAALVSGIKKTGV
jgi:DNA-binding XRE family transcriptional regulator